MSIMSEGKEEEKREEERKNQNIVIATGRTKTLCGCEHLHLMHAFLRLSFY